MDHTAAKAIIDAVKSKYGRIFLSLQKVAWENIARPARDFIVSHPKLSAIFVAFNLIVVMPELVAGPAFWTMGFSALGPVAGGAAATFQSAFGTNVIFSCFQSAAMAGYGARVVGSTISIVAAIAAAVTVWFRVLIKGV